MSGLCNRSSCPLANSRYATIREVEGRLYLFMKTVERAHTPAKLWQRVRLAKSYAQALAQVDEHLAHWPKFLVHKNKQRLTKITQYRIRARRLATSAQPTIVPVARSRIIGLPPGLSVIDTHAMRESAAKPSPSSTSFGRWSGSGMPRVVTNSAP